MNNPIVSRWFALFPGSFGLEVMDLGMHEDFDSAADHAAEVCRDNIWIFGWDDLICLNDSIARVTSPSCR